MTALVASVQTSADTAATPLWLYGVGALFTAFTFAWPWLLAAYTHSEFHRRGLSRLRRAHTRPTDRGVA